MSAPSTSTIHPQQANEKFQRALALHCQGQLDSAEAIYQELLRNQPAHAGALQYLGVLATQRGDAATAVQLLARATGIVTNDALMQYHLGNAQRLSGQLDAAAASYTHALAIRPQFAEAYVNRGIAHCELNRQPEALADYDQAVSLRGDLAEAYSNRGDLLRELGRFAEALADCDRAITLKSGLESAHYNRGLVLRDLGLLDGALASFGRALVIRSDYAQARIHRGRVLLQMERIPEALADFEATIALRPGDLQAQLNRGEALRKLGQLPEALASYDALIQRMPDFAEAHFSRGCILQELRQFEAALASYERAIALKPELTEAVHNRGLVLRDLWRLEAALASHEAAIRLNPQLAEAHCNRGIVLQYLQQWEAAMASYTRAIELRPDYDSAHYNRAQLRLLLGDFDNGWAEHEWRWRCKAGPLSKARRNFSQPLWLGDGALSGRSILLHGEQGLGDSIQFCRYAPLLARQGAKVILEVPGPLVSLLSGLEGVAQCIARGAALPVTDYHCPLMSLPLALGTTLQSVPATVPYLKSDPRKVHFWRERLGEPRRPRVGLVWSGGFRPDQPETWLLNSRRNIPLKILAPLQHAKVDFHSLQKGEPADSELADLRTLAWDGPPIRDHAALLHDFSDTAALIENLDLVISVDTSTAHLAAALARPVWILNRHDTCWRWLLERSDSPWYPTVRLYRQKIPGAWDEVVQRVLADLQSMAS